MKCDDDTFIRVERILKDIEGMSPRRPLYLGNLNLLHRPLRTGKWAVSYEVRMLTCVRRKMNFSLCHKCFQSIRLSSSLSAGVA